MPANEIARKKFERSRAAVSPQPREMLATSVGVEDEGQAV